MIKLDGASCTVKPHKLTISPQGRFGWEITVSQVEQEVLWQYQLFGLELPLKRHLLFSDIVSIRAIRTDVPVYQGTSFAEKFKYSLSTWQIVDQELLVGRKRKGFRHDVVFRTTKGITINVVSGTTTWDDLEAGRIMSPGIADVQDLLRKMILNL